MRCSGAVPDAKAFRRSGLCFNCFDLAIPWRRVGHQRIKKVPGDMGHILNSVVEGVLISL